MRIATVIFGSALLVLSLVQYSDAVACSDTVTTDCTDCTLEANAELDDCTTTTTTTTTEATTTVSTATSSSTTTATTSRRRLLRRIRVLQNKLNKCKKNAARQRAALKKQIASLSANSNGFKNKLFG
ncbi:hypothetical protein KR044_004642 [Drosophila immigrans]|nr:hypothetical protein KR044_004642 [Drosophila immigrans]